jgi:hypothetical protein
VALRRARTGRGGGGIQDQHDQPGDARTGGRHRACSLRFPVFPHVVDWSVDAPRDEAVVHEHLVDHDPDVSAPGSQRSDPPGGVRVPSLAAHQPSRARGGKGIGLRSGGVCRRQIVGHARSQVSISARRGQSRSLFFLPGGGTSISRSMARRICGDSVPAWPRALPTRHARTVLRKFRNCVFVRGPVAKGCFAVICLCRHVAIGARTEGVTTIPPSCL